MQIWTTDISGCFFISFSNGPKKIKYKEEYFNDAILNYVTWVSIETNNLHWLSFKFAKD